MKVRHVSIAGAMAAAVGGAPAPDGAASRLPNVEDASFAHRYIGKACLDVAPTTTHGGGRALGCCD